MCFVIGPKLAQNIDLVMAFEVIQFYLQDERIDQFRNRHECLFNWWILAVIAFRKLSDVVDFDLELRGRRPLRWHQLGCAFGGYRLGLRDCRGSRGGNLLLYLL